MANPTIYSQIPSYKKLGPRPSIAEALAPEEWRPVVGYDGLYEVSSHARVRAIGRILRFTQLGKPKQAVRKSLILKQSVSPGQYYRVRLIKNGEYKNFVVQRLLAIAFIPNLHGKSQVNHIDGDKLNNALSNLEWVTPHENQMHAHFYNLIAPHKRRTQIIAYNNEESILFTAKKYSWAEYDFYDRNVRKALKTGRLHKGFFWVSFDDFYKLPSESMEVAEPTRRGSKLCISDARLIKRRIRSGERYASIAADYDISESSVSEIKTGRTWSSA